jgi:membrane-associated protease RseP (regulator of RpoE activity)
VRWKLHIGLFLATFLCTTLNGGLSTTPELTDLLQIGDLLLEGLLFSVPLMLILTAHEMGHYLACRRHGLDATLPFFIPFPLGIVTLGALIRIREPIRTRQQLLDVGAAGPLAGFIVLVPLLVYGLLHSDMVSATPGETYLALGEPLLLRLLVHLLGITIPAGSSLALHPVALAAWFGMLVTLLNLLPFAQLDGGHILYALLGRTHRLIVWPLLAALLAMGFIWYGWWLWLVIVLILRVRHPRIPDEHTPLDPRRRLIALASIVVFVLCFSAAPITIAAP